MKRGAPRLGFCLARVRFTCNVREREQLPCTFSTHPTPSTSNRCVRQNAANGPLFAVSSSVGDHTSARRQIVICDAPRSACHRALNLLVDNPGRRRGRKANNPPPSDQMPHRQYIARRETSLRKNTASHCAYLSEVAPICVADAQLDPLIASVTAEDNLIAVRRPTWINDANHHFVVKCAADSCRRSLPARHPKIPVA